jgi:hypothetical protein
MTSRLTFLAVVSLLLLSSGAAFAQRTPNSRAAGFNLRLELLIRKDVQEELELVHDQQERIRDLRTTM